MFESPVKILHTTISPCENERRIFNQAKTAYHNGAQVEILALKTPELSEISFFKEIMIKRIYIPFWRRGPLKFILFNIRLVISLLRSHYQILHAHDIWVMPGSVLANIFKKPEQVAKTSILSWSYLFFLKCSTACISEVAAERCPPPVSENR